MLSRDEAIKVFEGRRDAWLREDVDAYLAFFADDVVLQTPMGTSHGWDEYAALVRRSQEHVRPVSFEFHEIAVHGDRVLAEWTITIEFRANGGRASYDGMSSCELRDGRIHRWREYYDPSELHPASSK